jgi:hypothetical protein
MISSIRNFYAGLLHLSDVYGIIMKEEDYENIALHAWDHIGNKNYRIYRYCTQIEDGKVDLPVNVDIVEAVMKRGQDHQRTDGVNPYSVDLLNANLENYIEGWKIPNEFLYEAGTMIQYEQVGQTLYFKTDRDYHITVLYKGILVDEVGLPFLNFKEVEAIADYCAWVVMQKQGWMMKDQASIQIAQLARQKWQMSVDNARTPIRLNQNDMDRLLNVQSSWDRKRFGITYRPLR